MARAKIYRKPNLLYYFFVFLMVSLIIFFGYRLTIGKPLFVSYPNGAEAAAQQPDQGIESDLDMAADVKGPLGFIQRIWSGVSQHYQINYLSLIKIQMPFLSAVEIKEPLQIVDSTPPPEASPAAPDTEEQVMSRGPVERPPISENEFEGEIVLLDGEVDSEEVSEAIRIEISGIEDDLPPIQMSEKGPQILIYHTHSREAYRQDPLHPYKAIATFRSGDMDSTVVEVGAELARQLEARGIPVLHDTTDHEVFTWEDGLYPKSYNTIQKRLKEYDSLKVFLDIHRDYFEGKTKNTSSEVVTINGARAAKFEIVIGTGEGLVGGFSTKPNWKENYQFALKITNLANQKYPGLAKEITIKSGRYNQHVSTKAILIEIGNHLTTLEEAKRTTHYLAEIISEMMEE